MDVVQPEPWLWALNTTNNNNNNNKVKNIDLQPAARKAGLCGPRPLMAIVYIL
jgi:hypothetical protein